MNPIITNLLAAFAVELAPVIAREIAGAFERTAHIMVAESGYDKAGPDIEEPLRELLKARDSAIKFKLALEVDIKP